jgi:uncharacterized protein YkwD
MATAAHRIPATRRLTPAVLLRIVAVVAALAASLLLQPAPFAAPPPAHAEDLAGAVEGALLALINADRLGTGLAPVDFDPALIGIARARAATQRAQSTLSHQDAAGDLVMVRLLAESGVPYLLAGENLARWVVRDPGAAVQVETAWMNSATHRRNILQPEFNRLAIGAAADGAGQFFVAAIFRAAPEHRP